MVSFLLKEINPHSLRLINITLLFITSWNFSNRFSIYFLFQNKIEIDIYIFLFNIIRYFNYKIGSTLLSCDNSPTYDTYYDEYRSAPLSKELSFFSKELFILLLNSLDLHTILLLLFSFIKDTKFKILFLFTWFLKIKFSSSCFLSSFSILISVLDVLLLLLIYL